ncbi:MAG: PQQ-binding-like beta-propeller repeat protein [Chloroflexi bacterium]|nr:PQQ-binding-like beta-propeller repeat protein [Chloroflexota bacterium]
MYPQDIFCPQCKSLILAMSQCPKCKWERTKISFSGEGKELWRYNAEAKIHSAPMISGSSLFFGAENGDLFAVDLQTQAAIWTITLQDGYPSESFAAWSDRVFYGEMTAREIGPYDKCLVAVDAHTGKELWRFDTQAMNVSAPAVSGATVFAVSSGKVLYAVDAISGKEKWHKATRSAWSPAAPLATASHIFVPARGNELIAVDAGNGDECWSFAAQGWVRNTPAILDNVLYLSSWDSHLYALEANTGKLIWKFQADKYLISPPAVNPEIVCVGSRDKNLYILERATGKLLQRIKVGRVNGAPLMLENMILVGSDDHHLYAYDTKSFELLWSFDAGSKISTSLAQQGDAIYVAARDGHISAVQWRRKPQEISAESYEARGEIEKAAAAYALRGNFSKAASLYESLNGWHEAAALYEEAHEPEPAAVNHERAGELDSALTIWRELKQPRRAAELLEHAGRFAEAAPIYESLATECQVAGQASQALPLFARAGAMFEKAGQFAKAYDLYECAGDSAAALRVAGQLGDDRKAQALEKQKRYREAADLLRSKDPIKAAELYVQAGGQDSLTRAIGLYKQQNSKELLLRARELAEETRLWLEVADICQRLGDSGGIGRAVERAALDLETTGSGDSEKIAALYEKAAQAYHEALETDRQKNCERHVRQHRQWPEIVLAVNADQELYRQGESNTITVLVRNTGFGPARQVCLSIGGLFVSASPCTTTLDGIKADGSEVVMLDVRPQDRGPRVRLTILAEFQAKDGRPFKETQTIFVPVQPPPAEKSIEVINVGGDFMSSGARKVTGDYVEGTKTGDVGYASFGDKRGTGKKETCPNCGEPIERGYQFCPNCKTPVNQTAAKGAKGSS